MSKIKTYAEMLEYIKISSKIYEQAMSSEKTSKLKRLKDTNDIKGILKELQIDIDEVVKKCNRMNYDDIKYSYKNDVIEILYGDNIGTILSILKDKVEVYSNEEVNNRIFGGDLGDLYLEIELDKDILNRIDIMNSFPNFMKGIGFGKKIYKKIIKDFGYISSFNGYEPSLDSSMVWDSLAQDTELFTFSNDENLICFWNELEYETIIEKLNQFYEHKGNIQVDDDFLIKYNLSEEDFRNIIEM